MAMVAALMEMRARQSQQQPAQGKDTQKQKMDQRTRRGTPEPLARTIAMYAQQLGDNAKLVPSDITRAAKIYFASQQIFQGFRNAWFKEQLDKAFDEATHARGVKKRMAYFFSCLENRLELRVEERAYIRSEDPLYLDGSLSNFINDLRRAYQKSGSGQEYEEWVKQQYLAPKGALRL
jgi:hypothetical protein